MSFPNIFYTGGPEILLSGGAIEVTLVLAAETDEAITLDVDKLATLGFASETDEAVALDVDKLVALVHAAETDEAVGLDIDKLVTLGIAEELDVAVVLTISGPIFVTLTEATETDTAQPLAVEKRVTIVFPTELDAAVQLGVAKLKTLTFASETDAALALDKDKHVTLVPATELDEAIFELIVGCADPYRICDFPNVAAALAAGYRLTTNGYNVGQVSENWTAEFEKYLQPEELNIGPLPASPGVWPGRWQGVGPTEAEATAHALRNLNAWRDNRYDVQAHPITGAPRGGHDLDVT